HDEKIKVMTQINEHQYLFFADFPIDEFQEVLNVTIPDGNYHTLGGFIVEMLEHIPKEGEELHYGPLVITVTEVEKRRIRKVRVEVQGESYQEQLIQRPSLIKEPANG
ncbi:MAG TPA: transporter associated domain-containing protein, partial [Massilibacterium sp.]|nr:transporter associated domain-containing protein [Massilibacterium sp.]